MAEREEPFMHETALAGSIPPYTIHFFIGSSCQVRYVSYFGLRIVVTNVVEGQGFCFMGYLFMGFFTLSVVVKRDVATDCEGDQEHVSQNDRDVDGSVPEFQGFVLHCVEEQK